VLIGAAVCGLVLLQHGKGADMGAAFGSGSAGSLFGASGSANFARLLPRSVGLRAAIRRPATQETVRLFNGPGNNGSEIRNGKSYNLKVGDVVVIPAGTGHLFTKIDDHIDYLMVRIDPDKVTPLRDEAASQQYLKTGKQP